MGGAPRWNFVISQDLYEKLMKGTIAFLILWGIIWSGMVIASSQYFSSFEPKAQSELIVSIGISISKFSQTAWSIKLKFYVEPPWVVVLNFCSQYLGLMTSHMTKMAATPIL